MSFSSVDRKRLIDIKVFLNDAGRNETRRQRMRAMEVDANFVEYGISELFQLKCNLIKCKKYFIKYEDSDGDLIDFSTEQELCDGISSLLKNCPEEGSKEPQLRIHITEKGMGVQKPSEANSKKGGGW